MRLTLFVLLATAGTALASDRPPLINHHYASHTRGNHLDASGITGADNVMLWMMTNAGCDEATAKKAADRGSLVCS